MNEAVLCYSLRVLSELIGKHYAHKVILLIDEYDVPLEKAFSQGYYEKMLEYYHLSDAYDIVREWYDGYHFGNIDVYCPWDVICHCSRLRININAQPQDYWSNTSSNDIVKQLIKNGNTGTTKKEIEKLVAGESIQKEIHMELTYKDLYESVDHIWSVLFLTGYLTQQGEPQGNVFRLIIPNLEIRNIFTRQIMEFFRETIRQDVCPPGIPKKTGQSF